MFFQRGNRVGHGHCGLIIYIHETFLSQEVIIENVPPGTTYVFNYHIDFPTRKNICYVTSIDCPATL